MKTSAVQAPQPGTAELCINDEFERMRNRALLALFKEFLGIFGRNDEIHE
jgi:hypothetical protein